jgi:alanine-glyoxylate transaminase/serine-glyoxylate transaminase/serine-pyruvate transaminase
MPHHPNLSRGRGYLAIPGPSVIPEAVLSAMHRPSPNIYAGELPDLLPGIVADLKRVARTEASVAIYIGNGHAAWEAALSNVIAPGDLVLVPSTGDFAHGWADMAAGLGARVQMLDFGKRAPMDMARIAEALEADTAHEIKAVLAVHVDTSTSIRSDIAALRQTLNAVGHPALLMVDCIASLGADVFEMDAWGVDVMVAACQKGLMVPAGMCFVFFNARADALRRAMPRVSRYWDWAPRARPELFYHYWNGTAPTHHVFGLRAALDLIHAEGMPAVWARHAVLAQAIWAASEAWAAVGSYELNVATPEHRSHAVTSVRLAPPHATALRDWTEKEIGLTLGIGLGMAPPGDPAWHGFFRLGHMGHVNGHMIMGLLGGIEAGLTALDIPHGSGALEAASRVIAGR